MTAEGKFIYCGMRSGIPAPEVMESQFIVGGSAHDCEKRGESILRTFGMARERRGRGRVARYTERFKL